MTRAIGRRNRRSTARASLIACQGVKLPYVMPRSLTRLIRSRINRNVRSLIDIRKRPTPAAAPRVA